MKKCNKCQIKKELGEFYRNKQSKDGHRNNCKSCEKQRKSLYYSLPHIKEQEKIKKLEYRKIEGNANKAKEKTKKWYANNKDRVREYQIANAKNINANNAKYRAKKLNATPNWLTKIHLEEIKETYNNCPKGHHVDHIVPLQGKAVSGLHVPWNLRITTAKENLSKSNKTIKELL